MGYRLALVDFDGTLVDSMPFWLSLPAETLAEAGLPMPPELDARSRRIPLWEIARYLAREYPQLTRTGPLEEQWYARMREHYLHRIPLRPGADAFLEVLRRAGVRVWILSATSRPLLDTAVEHFGLAGRVERLLSEEEVGSKRTEEPYRRCMALAGTGPAETLLAEDSAPNLLQARSLGLGTVAVRDASMLARQEELRAAAGVYLPDFRDLSALEAYLQRGREEK